MWERKFDMVEKAPAGPVCPECGSKMVRIVYGYPMGDLMERSMRGEVALGGCVVSGFDVTHLCDKGHRWRWSGSSTQIDPAAAAGLVVPGSSPREATSGWVSMADPWDVFFDAGDLDAPEGSAD